MSWARIAPPFDPWSRRRAGYEPAHDPVCDAQPERPARGLRASDLPTAATPVRDVEWWASQVRTSTQRVLPSAGAARHPLLPGCAWSGTRPSGTGPCPCGPWSCPARDDVPGPAAGQETQQAGSDPDWSLPQQVASSGSPDAVGLSARTM